MADKTYSVTAAMTPRQRFVHDYVERFLLYWGLECAKRGVPFRDDGQDSAIRRMAYCNAETLWDVSQVHVIGRG